MSTPKAGASAPSRPLPRQGMTPAAPSPARSVPSPGQTSGKRPQSKGGKAPLKTPSSAAQTPYTASHTPNPLVAAAMSSPLAGADGLSGLHAGRNRAGTGVGKSTGTSELGTPGASALGLGLGSGALGQALGNSIINTTSARPMDAAALNQQKLKEITEILGTRWGRVSQKNLELCVKRIGVEYLWEDGAVDISAGLRARTLSIAGKEFLVDVHFLGEEVKNVQLVFPNASEIARSNAERGAAILKRNLTGSQEARAKIPELDTFASNLALLARTDKLGRPGFSCFEALDGLYSSLERIWKWEVEKTKTQFEAADKIVGDLKIEDEVLRRKCGRPMIYAGSSLGLKIEYWQHQILETDYDPNVSENTCSLLLECESYHGAMMPHARISDKWISDDVEKTETGITVSSEHILDNIDWQEPPQTVINVTDGTGDEMDIDLIQTDQAVPGVRFIATFDPPVALPLTTVVELFNLVGEPFPQSSMQPTTYASVLFPSAAARGGRPYLFPRGVLSWAADGRPFVEQYLFKLATEPQMWGKEVQQIPFSHPKQLIMILPVLRQWAFFGQLLKRSYDTISHVAPQGRNLSRLRNGSQSPQQPRAHPKPYSNKYRPPTPASDTDNSDDDNDNDDGDDNENTAHWGESPHTPPQSECIETQLELSYDAPPRIDLSYAVPLKESSRLKIIDIAVLPNATMMVETDANEVEHESSSKVGLMEHQKIQKILEIAEDLTMVAEWVRGSAPKLDSDTVMKDA